MLTTLSQMKSHGGTQGIYSHSSAETGTDMVFSVFIPPHENGAKLPILWYLSGLTCTYANVTEKGEFREACTRHGIIFIAPDTSPRGDDVPDADDAYDFGKGAGFYVDALIEPWAKNYLMRSYIEKELPAFVAAHFPVDMSRQSIMGHSMGGHGALTIALRNPDLFRSVSAFSPIVAPSLVPWGKKAFSGYLGEDRALWREYDAVTLIENGATVNTLLVDQGEADNFLDEQLQTHRLITACRENFLDATIRMHAGYDHSYYFISTFLAEHVAWHASKLNG